MNIHRKVSCGEQGISIHDLEGRATISLLSDIGYSIFNIRYFFYGL